MCFAVGTGSGLQFYFVVAASLAVLVLGIERIVLAGTLAALAVAAAIVLEILVPNDRGLGPSWALDRGLRPFGGLSRSDGVCHGLDVVT